jgi:hypothetical protein
MKYRRDFVKIHPGVYLVESVEAFLKLETHLKCKSSDFRVQCLFPKSVYFKLVKLRNAQERLKPEQWLACTRSDRYEVSSHGRIRRANAKHSIVKTTAYKKKGYKIVCLRDSPTHAIAVHRLVAEAFIPKPTNSDIVWQVNHKDLNKGNNLKSNLEWVTCKFNLTHCRAAWFLYFMHKL